jgi:hypothetical protein
MCDVPGSIDGGGAGARDTVRCFGFGFGPKISAKLLKPGVSIAR